MKGVYGALIGLVGGVLYKMIRNQKWNIYKIILIGFAFFSLIWHHELLFYVFGIVVIINYFTVK